MPLYDMKCGACGHAEEILTLSVNAPLPRKCPACKRLKFKRMMPTKAPAFVDTYSPMHPRRGRGKG